MEANGRVPFVSKLQVCHLTKSIKNTRYDRRAATSSDEGTVWLDALKAENI
jgi:hypothetical protein